MMALNVEYPELTLLAVKLIFPTIYADTPQEECSLLQVSE